VGWGRHSSSSARPRFGFGLTKRRARVQSGSTTGARAGVAMSLGATRNITPTFLRYRDAAHGATRPLETGLGGRGGESQRPMEPAAYGQLAMRR
jgi:hypothetical protein